MALEPGSNAWSGSPESSGRDSPIPRQWRNQLGGEEIPIKDKVYRRYALGVEKALALFETTLEEWADYISFLNRVLKALQARPSTFTTIPAKATIAKRLSQCLNPSLPSGVHQKALEVYSYVFETIGREGLARDLPLYLPGLAPTLSFASLSVRSPFLDLLEKYFVGLDSRSLRPAMRSIILALLPGLEDETSEDFDRTLHLVASFKYAIRPTGHRKLTEQHSTGDDFFWQCFFLATITSQSRRAGALAYLVRMLPALGPANTDGADAAETKLNQDLSKMVTSPEPGLLIRCFSSGLADEQILIQRGFLDLLTSHLPLNSAVLQSNVKSQDLELLLKAATKVVTRRDMSLNRRLWAWLLGPEPAIAEGDQSNEPSAEQQQQYLTTRTKFFEEYGLQSLTKALLDMINDPMGNDATERARPYRICLSLMDRWEIGGLVVPEIFLPVIESVQLFKSKAVTKFDFKEVLRSASVFFDGIESGLIYSELVGLLAQAIGPGQLSPQERKRKLDLTTFIITNFNVREEEMVTVHAPLTCLAALYMLDDAKGRRNKEQSASTADTDLEDSTFAIIASLLELVPERAFSSTAGKKQSDDSAIESLLKRPNVDLLKKVRDFYVHEQGNLESAAPPFKGDESGQLLLYRAAKNIYDTSEPTSYKTGLDSRVRIFLLILTKVPPTYRLETNLILSYMKETLTSEEELSFSNFASILLLATQLYHNGRITIASLSNLVPALVARAWSFLSIAEPKYHVEAVRCLWQLQTALSPNRRDVEAALSTLLVFHNEKGDTELARVFSVLWSHTLQDTQSERRGSKAPLVEFQSGPRLAGADFYEVMLTQPLFLILDTLLDDRTHEYMTVKSWLHTMIGIDRLLLLVASRLTALSFLDIMHIFSASDEKTPPPREFNEDDDVSLGLYYLRTLHHILQCSGDSAWVVLASKYITIHGGQMHISAGGEENAIPLQEYFVHACVRCITAGTPTTASEDLSGSASQLQRYGLKVLRQFLASRFASGLSSFHLENLLVERLWRSLGGQDPHIQVLLLDVIYDTLKLQDSTLAERPTSPMSERWRTSVDKSRVSGQSLSLGDRPLPTALPPQLLKCILSGLSAPSSRQVLDSWVSFLGACLPLYSSSIFQVVIPLVETLCLQVDKTFSNLLGTFQTNMKLSTTKVDAPESTLIYLLNGLEQVLARAHDQILIDEAKMQMMKSPDQPQSLFGSMVSGVFQSDSPQGRSATANDRLTVHLAIQDAVRICYKIWSWGEGEDASNIDAASSASFNYTSLRMRNRARRLLEHLFVAEALECLETVIDIWNGTSTESEQTVAFNFLAALEASRPRQTIPSLFNAIYSRTNPGALEPSRKSTMTISLRDIDLVTFLVHYTRSLDDDAMDEIWQDCITFLKDILANPFPHRQTLPGLLEFAAILGEKVDNTNFGEQRKKRRELGDLFLRLLAALFTTRPITFTESNTNGAADKSPKDDSPRRNTVTGSGDKPEDIMEILANVVPNLPKVLPESDRVLSAASTISTSVIVPTIRSKIFPDSASASTMKLLQELAKLPNNQKTWKKDVGDAFNDSRFFGMDLVLVQNTWLPLLKQWIFADKEKMPEIVSRITAPTTAGIVFGVGATSARLEADRRTQLNLRRIAALVLASGEDAFMGDLPIIVGKLVELLTASSTSSPSSTTRADIYMVVRALVLRTSPLHLSVLWPIVNAEIHAAISSVVAPDNSTASDTYTNTAVFQACKLLDLLICMAPDDFQLHEWLFITDNIDAVYRSSTAQPVALVDEISEDLGSAASYNTSHDDAISNVLVGAGGGPRRRPLLGPGGISEEVSLERKDELIAKVLRPFFGQLSIFAFESIYAMGPVDVELCVQLLLKDLFEERTMVKAL